MPEKRSEFARTNAQRWVAAGFGVAVLVLLGISVASVRNIQRFRDMAGLQNRTLRMQIGVEELFNDAMQVQRGQRGFTLTGDPSELAAYGTSHEKIRTGLDTVRALALHPEMHAMLEGLRSVMDDFLTHQEEIVRKRRAGRIPHDEQLAQRAEGLRHVDEMYRQIQEIHRLLGKLFEERTAQAEKSNRATLLTIYLGGFVAIAIVATAMILMRRDLRARLQAEQRLAAEQRLLASVIENTGDGLAVANATGQLVIMNPAGERILGRGLTDRRPEEWTEHYRLLLPDGSAPFPPEQIPMACALRGESVDDVDLLSRRPDGRAVLVRVTARPLLDAAGVPRGGVTTFRDVTELQRAEDEKKKVAEALAEQAAEVERANLKLASLNQELVAVNGELEAFSYSVSHDLRAPLRHMAGYAQILSEDFGEHIPSDGRRYLEKIQHGAVQMGRLIDALLNLGQIGRRVISREQVDLGRLVQEVQELLERDLAHRRVEWRIGPLPVVTGDSSLLRQVFVNLLTNALKYSRPRAVCTVEIGQHAANGTRALFVRDNGVGFDMKFAPKLFGVFQRLHRADEFEGTGVGLATVQRIVDKHGGRIWAESAPDCGAVFYFTLAPEPPAETEETRPSFRTDRRNNDSRHGRDSAGRG